MIVLILTSTAFPGGYYCDGMSGPAMPGEPFEVDVDLAARIGLQFGSEHFDIDYDASDAGALEALEEKLGESLSDVGSAEPAGLPGSADELPASDSAPEDDEPETPGVDELLEHGVPAKAVEALIDADCVTCADVGALSRDELIALPGIGPKAADKIAAALLALDPA